VEFETVTTVTSEIVESSELLTEFTDKKVT